MQQGKEDLSIFRAKIDAIDDKIIALLKDRMEIVKQVGEHKAKTSATMSFIRAGREANMLRDLTRKIDGVFPPAAIANMWRMIISTSLCTEQNMTIAAYVEENNRDCYWLAREYYGSFVKTDMINSADKVIENVASGKDSIGILPLKQNGKPWWVRPQDEKNNIYIFARIPFVEEKNNSVPTAIAIANVMPEPTADDISLFVIHSADNADKILAVFKENGIEASILANNGNDYLVESNNFIPVGDERIIKISQLLAKGSTVRLMGAYAAPIVL